MDNIKVSIIVPAYNVGLYLRDCLDSLLMQTLQEIEILVINNNSEDDTAEIIEEYAAKYPAKIIPLSQKIQGLSATRNEGLRHVKGKYIGFVDSDDEVVPTMYEKLYNAAEENAADLVCCGYISLVERAKQDKKDGGTFQLKFGKEEPPITNIFERRQALIDTNVFVWNKLYKTQIVREISLEFDEELFYCEDGMFNLHFSLFANKIYQVQESLYIYRVRRLGSATGTFNEVVLSIPIFGRKAAELYKKLGYFNLFQTQIIWIYIGYYRRKLFDAFKVQNAAELRLALKMVDDSFAAMQTAFGNRWKEPLRRYGTRNRPRKYKMNFYLTSKKLLKMRICIPKFVVFLSYYLLSPKNFVRFMRQKLGNIKRYRNRLRYKKNILETYLNKRVSAPLQENSILFSPSSGGQMSGNMFYLIKDVAKMNKYAIYVVSQQPAYDAEIFQKYGIKVTMVRLHSAEYAAALATFKYLATDTKFLDYFIKRDGQIVLNTWHGTPIKYLGAHSVKALRDLARNESHFMLADYLLFPNKYTKQKIMAGYFLDNLYSKNVLLTGYPRNSVFLGNETIAFAIRQQYNLQNKKVYVYMPTWRGATWDEESPQFIAKMQEYTKRLSEELNEDIVIYLKMHSHDSKQRVGMYKNVLPFPNNIEVYEFLNVADCLITDYSSVFFDFAATGKEIILFVFDAKEYQAHRGMYMNVEDVPFTKIYEIDDLIQHMNGSGNFKITAEYRQFQEQYCKYDSALSAKYVNQTWLEQQPLQNGDLIEFSANESKKFNVVFVPNIATKEEFDSITEKLENTPQVLLVIAETRFSVYSNMLIQSFLESGKPCVVANMDSPLGVWESFALKMYYKFGLFKKNAAKIFAREKERILPNIAVASWENFSEETLFARMAELL
ncbi:MAG: bifunctional glycosyltransferase family 2 protein/CDP-glycerol:glycerophosphate glycerophosphotransferase [Defluviitaleaceae bacterium]|nr:bifunctional glycosyltransferase family 2 protein/CDP-glycerol:glycerophosphate glycerophosphotransferase [Defluviitaleaceae bacterium]